MSMIVEVTFFNDNFVYCKATLILEIKNLRNKIQYKPKMMYIHNNNEIDKRIR